MVIRLLNKQCKDSLCLGQPFSTKLLKTSPLLERRLSQDQSFKNTSRTAFYKLHRAIGSIHIRTHALMHISISHRFRPLSPTATLRRLLQIGWWRSYDKGSGDLSTPSTTNNIDRDYLERISLRANFFREASTGIAARELVCGMMMITNNRSCPCAPSDCLGIVDHGQKPRDHGVIYKCKQVFAVRLLWQHLGAMKNKAATNYSKTGKEVDRIPQHLQILAEKMRTRFLACNAVCFAAWGKKPSLKLNGIKAL